MMTEVAVIGGGVGGMATAIRLAARGHQVTLYERRTELGGKLTERRRDGFTFGLGPSLLTLPGEFAGLAAEAGRKLDELVTLLPVDPVCRYHFADGSVLDAASDPAEMAAAVDRLAPGEGAAWQRYVAWGGRCWAASERAFLAGPLEMSSLSRRRRQPRRPARHRPGPDPGRACGPVLHRSPDDPVRRPVRHLFRFLPVSGAGGARLHPVPGACPGRLARPGRPGPAARRPGRAC